MPASKLSSLSVEVQFCHLSPVRGEEIVGERDSEEIPGAVTDKEGCNERTSL